MIKQGEWPDEYEFDLNIMDNIKIEYTGTYDVTLSFRTTPKNYDAFMRVLSGKYKIIPKNG